MKLKALASIICGMTLPIMASPVLPLEIGTDNNEAADFFINNFPSMAPESVSTTPARPLESTLPDHSEWTEWEYLGICDISYGGLAYGGDLTNLGLYTRTAINSPVERSQYRVDGYLAAASGNESKPLIIDIYDGQATVQPQMLPLSFPLKDDDGNPYFVYVADYSTYMGDGNTENECFYIFQNDSFTLDLVYYISAAWFGRCSEYVVKRVPDLMSVDEDLIYCGGDSNVLEIPFNGNKKIDHVKYACVPGDIRHDMYGSVLRRIMFPDDEIEIFTIDSEDDMFVRFGENDRGRYSVGAYAYDADGKEVGNFTARVWYMPDEPEKWKAAGVARYTDDLVAPGLNLDVPVFELPIEQSIDNPDVYRLTDIYHTYWPYRDAIEETFDNIRHYTYLHCEKPDAVWFSETPTGISCNDSGQVFVTTYATIYLGFGYDVDTLYGKAPSCFGKLKDGVITFAARMPLFTTETAGFEGWALGGFNNMFKIELPGTFTPSGVESCTQTVSTTAKYINLQGEEIATPNDGELVIEIRDGKATKTVFRRN